MTTDVLPTDSILPNLFLMATKNSMINRSRGHCGSTDTSFHMITTRQIESLSDDASTTSAIPASSSAINEHAKFDLYMDDDFSDEDLCDEGDTADFIDKDTASIPDEGLNTEENLPEESLSECVLVFEENQGSENSCHEVPAAEDPTADNTKVSCDEDPDQHDEDPPCKEVESADFPTKHDNQQGKKEEILPEEFVSSANELQCDFPMQGKNLVTRILVSNQDRTVTLRRSIRKNIFMSMAFLFAMLLVRIPIISFLRDLTSYYHLLARLVP
ncbi:hypothetical protein E4U47_000830 [Claviceps purpurea]|nr:hypothetical protein E4U47_000830 [Claviceps purpurea]